MLRGLVASLRAVFAFRSPHSRHRHGIGGLVGLDPQLRYNIVRAQPFTVSVCSAGIASSVPPFLRISLTMNDVTRAWRFLVLVQELPALCLRFRKRKMIAPPLSKDNRTCIISPGMRFACWYIIMLPTVAGLCCPESNDTNTVVHSFRPCIIRSNNAWRTLPFERFGGISHWSWRLHLYRLVRTLPCPSIVIMFFFIGDPVLH